MPLWLAPFPAAALGTICGVLANFVYDALANPVYEAASFSLADEALLFAAFSAAGFVVALGGLIVVGLPLTFLLREFAHSPWVVPVGAAIGGVAGRIVSAWLNIDIEWSADDILGSFGFPVGAFTGLFWTLFARKRLIRMQGTERWND